MIRQVLRRCDWPGCWSRREVDVELSNGSETLKARLCVAHADEVMVSQLPAAEHVEVWAPDGGHVALDGTETAARKLAIQRGVGMREARRLLRRKADPVGSESLWKPGDR